MLDPEQNYTFSDHYLNVPFDLSKVMFLCTANHLETIPAALRDRMEVISLPGYTLQEKAQIARKHLLPKKVEDNGLAPKDVELTEEALEKIIREYTREAGLRNLERELSSICRKLARRKAEGKKPPFMVDVADVEKLLGAPRFIEDEKEKKLMPGMALGLAWTPAGGEVLTVEATVMKGKGGLTLTGQLGDVMKESAQAALSYIRSRADDLGVDPGFVSQYDLHVHVPAGATPKGRPLGGRYADHGPHLRPERTACARRPVHDRRDHPARPGAACGRHQGKILAGVARGLKHVVIPHQNVKDLEDVPKELLKRITVHPVHHYDELLPIVFETKGGRGSSATGKGGKSKVEESTGVAAKGTATSQNRRCQKAQAARGSRSLTFVRLKQYIDEATEQLTKAGVDSPRLCAEVLARETLKGDPSGSARLFCILEAGRELTAIEENDFLALVACRATGQPLAQIIGRKEFYGRDFTVTPHTLIPRPETELIVDNALELLPEEHLSFADLGTGTGCIGITLAAERPCWSGILLDICPNAIAVAAQNAERHSVDGRIAALRADMRTPPLKPESLHLLVSNPPYIADAERHMVMDEVLHNEPHSALFSETTACSTLKQPWMQPRLHCKMAVGFCWSTAQTKRMPCAKCWLPREFSKKLKINGTLPNLTVAHWRGKGYKAKSFPRKGAKNGKKQHGSL